LVEDKQALCDGIFEQESRVNIWTLLLLIIRLVYVNPTCCCGCALLPAECDSSVPWESASIPVALLLDMETNSARQKIVTPHTKRVWNFMHVLPKQAWCALPHDQGDVKAQPGGTRCIIEPSGSEGH